ncbi:MAG: hypothetical protein GVY28_03690 [Alphaproteobacteria bacterium]|nr:hypothetical protein [Alphaproteobacteria bacterium]
MAQVIIRNLDDAVVQRLKWRAELHGRSLEQELREALTDLARLSPEEKVARARQIADACGPQDVDSTDWLRQDRDSRW